MEEHASHQEDDVTTEIYPDADAEKSDINTENEHRENDSLLSEKSDGSTNEKDRKPILCLRQEDGVAEKEISISSEERDIEGNLLSNVVTMHMTNCDDDYSPTLAICDIFNKTKASPCKNEIATFQTKEEEGKDEFLIIDLDTCQMERSSKNKNECNSNASGDKVTKRQNLSKDLVLINLSSQEDDVDSDFLNSPNQTLNETQSENNFLHSTKDYDIEYHDDINNQRGKSMMESTMRLKTLEKERKISEVNEKKSLNPYKLHVPTLAEIKQEKGFHNKEILFQDESLSDESILSKEIYSTDVSFHSNDLNMSLHSNENQESESVFYMPELYTKHYDDEDKNNDHSLCSLSKLSAHNSSLETDNCNQYYEPAVNDNTTFDSSLPSNQYNNSTLDLYEQHQTQSIHHYNFQNKIISNLVSMDTKNDTSSTYGLSSHLENMHPRFYKNKVSATSGSHKFSPFTIIQENTSTNPYIYSSYLPNQHALYPYNNVQQANDANPQLISSSASNSSDWNSWSSSTFNEMNLNTFSSLHNIESQYQQGKDEWSNTVIPDLYQDSVISVRSSNQTEIDSEATEDADEIDDVPIFFEDSTDFSTCDNLSTMSVLSGSCYSDTSSVMTPISPTDFTPPPTSNTPNSFNHPDMYTNEDHRFDYPFVSENSRSEPLHLYSPTMLSATPYKLANEKIDHTLLNYDRGQNIKRYYPSMADMHNCRSGLSVSPSSKFDNDEMFEFTDYRKCNKNQIQSDKISTSTSRSIYNKKKDNLGNCSNQPLEPYVEYMKQENNDLRNESRRLRHNEPLRQTAIRIMTRWYEEHLDNPYPTKEDKMKMAKDGGITVTQVKSWFANKRNRTNNTKPKVQKRAMKEKLKKLFQDLKHSRSDSLDNSHIIQQLSGIIQT